MPPSAAGTVPTTPHASRPLDLLAGCVGRGGGLGEVDLPGVDVAAELVEPAGQQVLHLGLGGVPPTEGTATSAAEPVDHPLLVDGVEDAGLGGQVGPVGHGRSLARVADAFGPTGALA